MQSCKWSDETVSSSPLALPESPRIGMSFPSSTDEMEVSSSQWNSIGCQVWPMGERWSNQYGERDSLSFIHSFSSLRPRVMPRSRSRSPKGKSPRRIDPCWSSLVDLDRYGSSRYRGSGAASATNTRRRNSRSRSPRDRERDGRGRKAKSDSI